MSLQDQIDELNVKIEKVQNDPRHRELWRTVRGERDNRRLDAFKRQLVRLTAQRDELIKKQSLSAPINSNKPIPRQRVRHAATQEQNFLRDRKAAPTHKPIRKDRSAAARLNQSRKTKVSRAPRKLIRAQPRRPRRTLKEKSEKVQVQKEEIKIETPKQQTKTKKETKTSKPTEARLNRAVNAHNRAQKQQKAATTQTETTKRDDNIIPKSTFREESGNGLLDLSDDGSFEMSGSFSGSLEDLDDLIDL